MAARELAVTIRDATSADVSAIHGIERASFGDPWSRAAFTNALESPEVFVAVADVDGSLAGYVVVRVVAGEGEILNVAVLPSARRLGAGRALLQHALHVAGARGALAVFLEVRPSNAAARGLYAAFGFVEVGRRTRYYRNPDEDALVLRRGPAVRPPQ
ncbi:MAG: ribosomal protein S18-alanine N-acetyltransferase [Gemmatimonadaceae bacterium]|nr:ribosomal protein S18-alanine N-acetyltransferase [Gemmatimonadaceae bacterium]